jgi:ribosomal protein S18 acetylase RimI-like enzyme
MTDPNPLADTVTYKPFRSFTADRLARFHCENLMGKLTRLGRPYVRYFYETLMKLDQVFGWTATRQENLVGLVLGSLDGNHLLGRVVRKDPVRWVFCSTLSAFSHPIHFVRVSASVMVGTNENTPSTSWPVLHYLAVESAQRKLGIGENLMRKFAGDLAARGQKQFELSVGQGNLQAIRFYEAHGGQAAGDYVAAGDKMSRYTFDVQKILN